MSFPHEAKQDGAAQYAKARRAWQVARDVALRDGALTEGDVPAAKLPTDDAITFRSYGSALNSLVGELLKDAAAHDAGRFDEIGRGSDRMHVPRVGPPELRKLRVALSFWDGWTDARDSDWPPAGNVAKEEWPIIARRIAADLAENREVSDAWIHEG